MPFGHGQGIIRAADGTGVFCGAVRRAGRRGGRCLYVFVYVRRLNGIGLSVGKPAEDQRGLARLQRFFKGKSGIVIGGGQIAVQIEVAAGRCFFAAQRFDPVIRVFARGEQQCDHGNGRRAGKLQYCVLFQHDRLGNRLGRRVFTVLAFITEIPFFGRCGHLCFKELLIVGHRERHVIRGGSVRLAEEYVLRVFFVV